MLKPDEIQDLFVKYINGECTEAEKALLESWYLKLDDPAAYVSADHIKKLGKEVFVQLSVNNHSKSKIKTWPRITTLAACTILAVSVWFYTQAPKKKQNNLVVHDAMPGGNHAKLILANGQSINLSSAKTGVNIVANQLRYNDGSTIAANLNGGMQILTTPKGGQYQIILPDSTKVWLNAETSLKFPATFHNSATRFVELSGEAYFEVAKDRSHPFVVKTQFQTLKVLGTHFNVSAYADENNTVSTLLEGRIKINDAVVVIPGQQAINNRAQIKISDVETDVAVAWKNGEFMFSHEPLESIMRKIARWYDVEVIYQDDRDKDKPFSGTISRFKNASEVLNILALTEHIHFKIEGRRIMVIK